MVFNYKQYYKWTKECVENAPIHSNTNYQIVVSSKNGNVNIKNEVSAIRQYLARERKKEKTLIFLIGVSSHDSRGNLQKIKVHSHKRGRPKTAIIGNKCKPHLHIFISSNSDNKVSTQAYIDTVKFIKKRTKKHNNLKQLKSSSIEGMGYCKYLYRQADNIYSDGEFDWDYFNNLWYDDAFENEWFLC